MHQPGEAGPGWSQHGETVLGPGEHSMMPALDAFSEMTSPALCPSYTKLRLSPGSHASLSWDIPTVVV